MGLGNIAATYLDAEATANAIIGDDVSIDADGDALSNLAPFASTRYGALVGASIRMRQLFATLERLTLMRGPGPGDA